MYIQWIKECGSTSYSQTFIIPCLPRFDKLDFSLFQLYIETKKMTLCFVCCNCKNTILIRAAEGKENCFVLYTC